MIIVEGLTKRYDLEAVVSDLSFTVAAGELFVFLGPNGAGKTSTIKMLTGQLAPSAGTALVAGHDVGRDPLALKRVIGYMAEAPYLYDKLSGREFLAFIADIFGVTNQDRQERTARLLRLFDLEEAADLIIEAYSQGMRQKIALASVLIHEPKVLFLDEPTNGLDPRSARIVKNVLRDICQRGATVFLTTHLLDVAEQMCDRIAILNVGRLVAIGSMAELRRAVALPAATLEEIYLHLTGSADYGELGLYAADRQR